jgi:hypothetical protein
MCFVIAYVNDTYSDSIQFPLKVMQPNFTMEKGVEISMTVLLLTLNDRLEINISYNYMI